MSNTGMRSVKVRLVEGGETAGTPRQSRWRSMRWSVPFLVLFLFFSVLQVTAQATNPPKRLKDLSLEELGNIQVVSYNKAPSELWDTPAAVYVITGSDIQRSGATSIAEACALLQG